MSTYELIGSAMIYGGRSKDYSPLVYKHYVQGTVRLGGACHWRGEDGWLSDIISCYYL